MKIKFIFYWWKCWYRCFDPGCLLDLGTNYSTNIGESSGKKLGIYNDGTSFYGFGISTNTLEFHANNNPTTTTLPQMVLNANGNVGIGVPDPKGKLHVNGSTFIYDNSSGSSLNLYIRKSSI